MSTTSKTREQARARQVALRARTVEQGGRQLATLISPAAVEALAQLVQVHGTTRAALEAALIAQAQALSVQKTI